MDCNEFSSDLLKAAKEAIAKLNEDFKKATEALCELAQDVAEAFKNMLEEIKYIYRDPLPQPQKSICMKNFVLDRRKTINRIKKKKGTVYPCFYCVVFIHIKQNVCKASQSMLLLKSSQENNRKGEKRKCKEQ